MTLPTTYSWCVQGHPLRIPYEAPQGRRVNAIGAVFTHGPNAGNFSYKSYASLPKSKAKTAKGRDEAQGKAVGRHGLTADEVGPINADRFASFIWEAAGRPEDAPSNWKRERPLMVVLDNYSVHKSQTVQDALPLWEAADIFLVPLPSYCPQLSRIEPVWNDVKHHHLPTRSCQNVAQLKQNVEDALGQKAQRLKQPYNNS